MEADGTWRDSVHIHCLGSISNLAQHVNSYYLALDINMRATGDLQEGRPQAGTHDFCSTGKILEGYLDGRIIPCYSPSRLGIPMRETGWGRGRWRCSWRV